MLTDDRLFALQALCGSGELSESDAAALRAALDTIREQAEELARLRAEVNAFRAHSLPALARCAEELVLLRRLAAGYCRSGNDVPDDAWAAYGEWRERFGGPAK